jgi:hypothetical protein
LDGGRIIRSGTLNADISGDLHFKFQAGRETGLYEVSVRQGTNAVGIQLWVLDDQHPEKNPPALTPGN